MEPMELKDEEVKHVENKGVKRKLEIGDVKGKKEYSKKAYLRLVQAYKRKWKEQKVQLVEDTPTN